MISSIQSSSGEKIHLRLKQKFSYNAMSFILLYPEIKYLDSVVKGLVEFCDKMNMTIEEYGNLDKLEIPDGLVNLLQLHVSSVKASFIEKLRYIMDIIAIIMGDNLIGARKNGYLLAFKYVRPIIENKYGYTKDSRSEFNANELRKMISFYFSNEDESIQQHAIGVGFRNTLSVLKIYVKLIISVFPK